MMVNQSAQAKEAREVTVIEFRTSFVTSTVHRILPQDTSAQDRGKEMRRLDGVFSSRSIELTPYDW